jgi:hypothetical protein
VGLSTAAAEDQGLITNSDVARLAQLVERGF